MSQNTKVTLFKGGTKESTLPISEVTIPDLWFIANAIRTGEQISILPAAAEQILDCWHIAGALKNHIANQPD